MAICELPISDAVKTVTMDVVITGFTKFRIRMVIGKLFIRLGARIIGLNIKIEER